MKRFHQHAVATVRKLSFSICILLLAFSIQAETPDPQQTPPAASEKEVAMSVEELKKQVIKLNRDLYILEEDLLFPANTQFVVYLSLSTGQFLALDSVTLKVNNEIVAAHLYTERQIEALKRGGMQRLHIGNLKNGTHELIAIIEGIGPDQQAYKLAASAQIEKQSEVKAVEIRIEDLSSSYQPSVQIIEWEK
jgi:hypothetical protein